MSSGLTPESLLHLRRELHAHPEISGNEVHTAGRIAKLAAQWAPDRLLTGLGGHGVAVVFEGPQPGPVILVRCELDGLPLMERTACEHASVTPGVSHLCGHDGHMAIVAGLFSHLSASRPGRGSVILLFQPAEETGEGANAVLKDPQFVDLRPDWVFALHNIPGFPLHSVIVRNGPMACASTGLVLSFQGKTSHAAEPENGINPALAVSGLIPFILSLPEAVPDPGDFRLATIVGIRVGGPAFGTSAGDGEILATLRSSEDPDLDRMLVFATEHAGKIARQHGLSFSSHLVEPFPATTNHPEGVGHVVACALENGLQVLEPSAPFRWSEDFGHFTGRFPGVLFGLGAGEKQPALHHESYDFPDELVQTGISMFLSLIRRLLGEEQ